MSCNDVFRIDATLVANEFLDKYMPSANGDYVKVYLYLLRNRTDTVDVESIAEFLELTEGDVRRAVRYWEKCGILSLNNKSEADDRGDSTAHGKASGTSGRAGAVRSGRSESGFGTESVTGCNTKAESGFKAESASETVNSSSVDANGEIRSRYKRTEGKNILNRLNEDAEFKQLLFMVQKYRSKILTESEEQVLAYLYDGLHLPFDVMDYLVQYCVETNHNNMRYIEKTGLDWANIGIRTVKEAKRRTREFDKLKSESSARNAMKKQKDGIQGETKDLDSWLNELTQRNIQ